MGHLSQSGKGEAQNAVGAIRSLEVALSLLSKFQPVREVIRCLYISYNACCLCYLFSHSSLTPSRLQRKHMAYLTSTTLKRPSKTCASQHQSHPQDKTRLSMMATLVQFIRKPYQPDNQLAYTTAIASLANNAPTSPDL